MKKWWNEIRAKSVLGVVVFCCCPKIDILLKKQPSSEGIFLNPFHRSFFAVESQSINYFQMLRTFNFQIWIWSRTYIEVQTESYFLPSLRLKAIIYQLNLCRWEKRDILCFFFLHWPQLRRKVFGCTIY